MYNYTTAWNQWIFWINVKGSVDAFTQSCTDDFSSPLKAKFLKTLCYLTTEWVSQSMPHDKHRKRHRIFLCEWSVGCTLRPLVRTSFHLPLQPKPSTLPACPYPQNVLHGAALCVGWQVRALPASPRLQPQGVQPTQGHLSSSSTLPFLSWEKILERWLLTTISGVFLLFLSQEQNIATQKHSTISRVFTCLDRIVHLIEASTCNEQPVYPEIW